MAIRLTSAGVGGGGGGLNPANNLSDLTDKAAARLNLGSAPRQGMIYVDDYAGVDNTGATDSTAAIAALQTARGTNPYMLVFGPGTYRLGTSSNLLTFGVLQGAVGAGSVLTTLDYRGAGTCLNFKSTNFATSSVGSRVGGFTIDGNGSTAGAIGLAWGDMNHARGNDLGISNFAGAGSIGLSFKNSSSAAWSEQAEWTAIVLVNNKINVQFDTSSFDYSVFQFLIIALAGQDGVRLQNNANLAGVRLEIRGNFVPGVGNTAAVLSLDPAGANTTGGSYITGAQFNINVECSGSTGVGHYTIRQHGSNACQITGSGVVFFNNITLPFQGTDRATQPLGISGYIGDPSLGQMGSDGLAVQGGMQRSTFGTLNSGTFSNNLYLQFGDIYEFQLTSGAQTLTFSGVPDKRSKTVEVFIAQPASGGAGTVVWPANVVHANGITPNLSGANNAVDWFRMTYLPDVAKWYVEHVADPSPVVTANTQTTSYTLALTDAGRVVEQNVASANNVTVPPNSSVAFPLGTVIEVLQYGAGQVTVVAGAGVTIRNPSSLTSRAQYATLALRKRGTDEWVLSGDLT